MCTYLGVVVVVVIVSLVNSLNRYGGRSRWMAAVVVVWIGFLKGGEEERERKRGVQFRMFPTVWRYGYRHAKFYLNAINCSALIAACPFVRSFILLS